LFNSFSFAKGVFPQLLNNVAQERHRTHHLSFYLGQ